MYDTIPVLGGIRTHESRVLMYSRVSTVRTSYVLVVGTVLYMLPAYVRFEQENHHSFVLLGPATTNNENAARGHKTVLPALTLERQEEGLRISKTESSSFFERRIDREPRVKRAQ